jgi:hypothetical protein
MALLKLPKRFHPDFSQPGRKPVGNVEIDYSNPITRGLRLAPIFQGNLYDPASNSVLSSTLATLVRDEINSHVKIDSYTALGRVDTPAFDCTNWAGVTVISLFKFAGIASQFPAISSSVKAGDFRGNWMLSTDGNGGIVQFRAGDATTAANTVETYNDQDVVFAAGTWDGATIELQCAKDNTALSSVTAAQTTAFTGVAAENYIGYYSRTGGRSYTRPIYYVMVWDRALSQHEIESIRCDPYQILKPAVDPIYFTSSGAAGTYTLTADVTSFSLGGDAVNFQWDRILSADVTSYALGGDVVNFQWDRVLTADVTTYTLGGDSVNLTYTPTGAYILNADATTYTLGGDTTNLLWNRVLSANVTTYTLTFSDATLTKDVLSTPDCHEWLYSEIIEATYAQSPFNLNAFYQSEIDSSATFLTSAIDDDATYLTGDLCS